MLSEIHHRPYKIGQHCASGTRSTAEAATGRLARCNLGTLTLLCLFGMNRDQIWQMAYPSKLWVRHDLLDDFLRRHVELLQLLLPVCTVGIPLQSLHHAGVPNTLQHCNETVR